MSNRKLFINLALEERWLGNRSCKAFKWENIVKAFNMSTDEDLESRKNFMEFFNNTIVSRLCGHYESVEAGEEENNEMVSEKEPPRTRKVTEHEIS